MHTDISEIAKQRHTAKAYDANKPISADILAKLKELLRFSPSSVNSQPWHFIVASTPEGKQRVATAAQGDYGYNQKNILDASAVVVFCSKLDIDEAYIQHLVATEEKDGRFVRDPEAQRARQIAVRHQFINLHKHDLRDVQHWMDKQVYLNLGQFLLGAAALGLDATPMEGIDVKALDSEFDLRQRGYTSLVAVCLGYHHPENDYNARLPKSRLPIAEILTEI
ncbi:MAG: oxygen-insensitive NAD(P)H nitroreductase [Rickettsiales bacterium]|nr:oxygen-insensitive NAD(P)H nitroreductase [Rickettsiales bacterium]|tara:strand:+ start:36 stop:704 length:669 start_codon:yes stop_codon:yes gene_type:complete